MVSKLKGLFIRVTTRALIYSLTCCCTCGLNNRLNLVIVSGSRKFLLLYKYSFTNRALLAVRNTCFCTGCGSAGDNFFGVRKLIDFCLCYDNLTANRALSAVGQACFCTGCGLACKLFDSMTKSVTLGCTTFRACLRGIAICFYPCVLVLRCTSKHSQCEYEHHCN